MDNKTNKYGFREDFNWETKTEINGYVVSTVDLGLDHSFGIGAPLYYETMIFKKDGNNIDFHDLYCKRYSTEDEAREGHQKAIEYVKNDFND